MRLTAPLAGVFLCAVVFIAAGSSVNAEAPEQISLTSSKNIDYSRTVLAVAERPAEAPKPVEEKPQEKIIETGETLSVIAEKYQTTWVRLYAKNLQIANPDIINAGEKIVIPKPDEQLAERALPAVIVESPAPEPVVVTPQARVNAPATPRKRAPTPAAVAARSSSSGNTYSVGYCTWYAKNRRPDMPNNLGNAETWVARASAQGMATGSAPRAGAIGQTGNHVVYVESVNGDGTITVSEMNRVGLGVVSSRTVPANYFMYIY